MKIEIKRVFILRNTEIVETSRSPNDEREIGKFHMHRAC